MNLCGGIVSVSEHEMLMDDHFSIKPRRKSSSTPSSNRRRRGVPTYVNTNRKDTTAAKSSQNSSSSSRNKLRIVPRHSSVPNGPDSPAGPGFLNPISKEDLKMSRSRQRAAPVLGQIKKLEDGINLKLVTDDDESRNTNLQMEQDKVHLRIRCLDKGLNLRENSEDSENDGSKSNFADIRLKLRDLARIDVGADKYATSKSSSLSIPSNGFALMMKKSIGDSNSFIFEADSLADRDLIVGALQGLLEQSKFTEDSKRRNRSILGEDSTPGTSQRRKDRGNNLATSSRRSHQGSDGKSNDPMKRSSSRSRQTFPVLEVVEDDNLKTSAVFCGFDDEHIIDTFSQRFSRMIEIDDDNNCGRAYEIRDDERLDITGGEEDGPSQDKDKRETSDQRERELSLTVVDNPGLREVGVEVAGLDDILCGLRTSRQTRSSFEVTTVDSAENEPTIEDIKASLANTGCHALGGCQSQALAAVEDVELAAMANQMAGPWCTDDICTASLKDFADAMKGIFEIKQKSREERHPDSDKHRAMAEEYISGVLGPQTAMSTLLSVRDIWKPASKRRVKTKIIRNRATRVGGPARRLRQLKNRMTFNAAATRQHMAFVQVISSFDDIDVAGRWSAGKFSAQQADVDDGGPSPDFFDRVTGTTGQETKPSSDENEEVFYDSDPEYSRERAHRNGPRRVVAEMENIDTSRQHEMRQEALGGIGMNRLMLNRRWKKFDDDIITEVIENMKNETMTLMWHPTQTKMNQSQSPVCVKARIESGVYLIDGTFLLPKLAWIPLHEDELQAKQLNIGKEMPESLDLLDVCRVRECDEINRELHPFARTERSFIVQTQSGLHLFETESKQERNRLVVGLKLVIARLASLLMLRDLRAVDEFFGGNSVPGEAPAFVAGSSERDPGNKIPPPTSG
eukprot:CAMPEP_0116996638 /NCGR_PEP_ID=MMETSP0472-20121206/379_1 /TAXON_ID=693140 ORGANISM="Tiarina fusus, Strain LIS" /NCGR_SAMPLE_ID=MMETSP0472 /ASSEMBLY_ACC=CAM_ASM_000603 /LENGTH=908 /DNA_ID=CAMNT_0004695329 /DNA_START=261 /DNA_END=2987 /DNA_ORIENTATION=-